MQLKGHMFPHGILVYSSEIFFGVFCMCFAEMLVLYRALELL